MNKTHTKLGCVLLILVCILVACSGRHATRDEAVASALDDMRAAARRHVDDLERQGILLEAIDGMQSDLRAFDEALAQSAIRVREVNARPDVTRGEFEALLDELDAARKAARERILRRHFDMIVITDAGEWANLSRYERNALMAAGR